MATEQPAQASLFNNPVLSDMKLLQVYKGETKEYHVHKQILSCQSRYFMNAFTGNFKEATNTTMKLEDDDPVHFEFVLQFMYTTMFDKNEIQKSTSRDKKKMVAYLVGISKVADKYNVPRLIPLVADELAATLKCLHGAGFDFSKGLVESYYSHCVTPGTPLGLIIAHSIIRDIFSTSYTNCPDLLKAFPTLAVDIALRQIELSVMGVMPWRCDDFGGKAGVRSRDHHSEIEGAGLFM
ncbi:hypothetical protein K491DRAFT_713350 [Lophiostoma macrostomum CBS 122681]|uniref:BTB domain-containing protein n=1 Tax=Lophiostoma macrostomum CBS 122681 TaxID=1314788 RepID=A0A6A6TGS1_9PLEO|nr:hypothetical protein K491DRAFT_713350 [Lophiostoma macrostomum CBS 122681]